MFLLRQLIFRSDVDYTIFWRVCSKTTSPANSEKWATFIANLMKKVKKAILGIIKQQHIFM